MFNKKKNGKKAFTLVELLVVIAILAILATVSTVGYLGFIENARRSKDIQLVSNINHVLAAEQAYTDSPVAAVEIVENLEEKGFELKTESKNAYLFYNTNTNRVELGDFDENGYKKVYPEEETTNSSIETFGKLDDLIYAPESFIDGYLLIGKSSRDGFADAINTIRNPKSFDDITKALENIGAFDKATKLNTNGMCVHSILTTFVGNAAFIGADSNGDSVFIDENTLPKRYAIFSQTVVNLNKATIDKITSRKIRIVDIPSNVKTVDDNAYDYLKKLVDNSTVIASQEFIDMLNAKGWKEIAINVVPSNQRGTAVSTVKFVKKYGDETASFIVECSKNYVEISSYEMMQPHSSDNSKAWKFVNWSYENNGREVQIEKIKNTNNYGHAIDADDELLQKDDQGNLVIYINFVEVDATAKIGDMQFITVDAIRYASGNNIPDEIIYTGNNDSIEDSVILSSEDKLYLPRMLNDSTDYEKRKEGNGISNTRVNPTLFSSLNVNNTITVNGTIYIGGEQYSNNSMATGQLNSSYAQINLGNSGKLVIEQGGTIFDYGKIIGNSETTQLQINYGAKFYVFMATESWRGNSVTEFLAGDKVPDDKRFFPVSNYKFENNFVKTRINSGGTYFASFTTRVSSSIFSTSFPVIGTQDTQHSSKSLFDISKGYIEYYYDEPNDRISIDMFGEVNIGKLSLSISGIEFNSEKFVLPISGRISINAKTGSIMNIKDTKGIKLAPGATMNIEQGAVLNVENSTFAVYQWSNTWNSDVYDNFGFNKNYEMIGTTYLKNGAFQDDASLIINGTLNVTNSYFMAHFSGEGEYNPINVNYDFKLTESDKNGSKKDGCGFTTDVSVQYVYATRDGKTSFNGVFYN